MRTETETAVRLSDGGPEAANSLLGRFHAAGVLGLADVHTALGLSRIGGEPSDLVLLAVALTVRALRAGSVCVDLTTAADIVFEAAEEQVDSDDLPWPEPQEWLAALRASPLVTDGTGGPTRPLRLVDNTLYLERYWGEEELVRTQLRSRLGGVPTVDRDRLRAGLDRIFDPRDLGPAEADRQRIAAAAAVLGQVTVLAGGPGTGKTTTVAKLLALLADQPGQRRVALAAPTGKAAARLAEAVAEATAKLPPDDRDRVGSLTASTLHRLLGSIWDRPGRFVHHAANHLPYEVVVVDEMSMVSLPMMARLLEAIRPDARLILVGDPDQLTSVEAGAVMADIVHALPHATTTADDPPAAGPPQERLASFADDGRGIALPDDIRSGVVRLTHTWRFAGAISQLATAIREGDADRVCEVAAAGHDDLEFIAVDPDDLRLDQLTQVRQRSQRAAIEMVEAAKAGDARRAATALDAHRVLCAHRSGPFGVRRWTREIERWWQQVGQESHGPHGEAWYVGRPVLITANNYELGLFNGDTGVVIDTGHGLRAVFPRDGQPLAHAPSRLEKVQTVHAMTVHQGQGSQFTEVTFVLPPQESPLLTRELVYTAVTRATDRVTIIGSLAALHRAVSRPANRASGLRTRL